MKNIILLAEPENAFEALCSTLAFEMANRVAETGNYPEHKRQIDSKSILKKKMLGVQLRFKRNW